ncbi:MAG: right-handed parallel beta-helix repeat-containing protein [Bdellovibrionota bacterium]
MNPPSTNTKLGTLLAIAVALGGCPSPTSSSNPSPQTTPTPDPTPAPSYSPNPVSDNAVTVSPAGDDVHGDGTVGSPYRTLTKASQVVSAGGTIHLLAGTYSAGEQWPAVSGWPAATDPANVPAGVSVIGDAGAVLSGGGAAVALTFAGSGSAQGLEITGFQRGVLIHTGSVTLNGLYVHDNSSDGIFVYGSGHADVIDSRVSTEGWGGLVTFNSGSISTLRGRVDHNRTGAYGNDAGSFVLWQTELDYNGTSDTTPQRQGAVYITTQASVTISPGTHIHHSRYAGVYVSGSGNVDIESSEIDHNGGFGTFACLTALCSGITVEGTNPVTVSGGSLHDNNIGGISWDLGDAKITLQGGLDIYSNGSFGVYAGGTRNGYLQARQTTIRQNNRYGLVLAGSPGSVDFGYNNSGYQSAGNNVIRDNRSATEGTAFQIRDSRTSANAFSTTFYKTAVGVNNPGYPAAQDVWSPTAGANGAPALALANFWQIDQPYVHLLFQ